jgi:nickel transport protein
MAPAHEVLHSVERGRALALRAWHADGEPMAYCQYEVFSPADPKVPHQKGRTDRSGWVAFVPDVPGAWRVKVVDTSGHGLETTVEALETNGGGLPAPGGTASTVAFVLRPLAGLAAIGAVFAVLFAVYRRRRSPP